MAYPFANLTPASTFVQWYTQTNEISTFLNTQIVANGQWAYGAFKIGANSSLNVANAVSANDSVLKVGSNTEIGNSTTGYVQFLGDAFVVASNTVLLNPITSVFVNSAITVNGTATFLGTAYVANASIVNLATTDIRSDGNITANNGTLIARQLLLTTNGATVNSTLAAPGYSDHTFGGLEDATIWNALPTTNTVISGLDAHTAVTGSVNGARILILQNLSTTHKITLSAANTSSTAQHRFESVNNLDIDVLPRQSVLLMYAKETLRWRIVGGTGSAGGSLNTGNTTISGWLAVTGNTTLSANLAAAPLYVNQITGRVGVGTASPTVLFHSIGPNTLEDITILTDARTSKLTVSSNSIFAGIKFYANGVAVFDDIVTVNGTGTSYIKKLSTDQLTSVGGVTGVGFSGVTGAFSGAVTVGGKLSPLTDGQLFGDATHRWSTPFVSLSDGAADAGASKAVLSGTNGELKTLSGYTGTFYVQGYGPDGGAHLHTYKGGVLVSIGPAV